jgi:multidrug resistance efflux pump
VKPGQQIKKGDILFQIDDRDQKAILNGAKADIVIAESKLQQSIAEIAIAKAKEISASSLVEEGIAEFNNYNEVLKRDQKLFERNSVSVEQLNILKFKVAEAKSKVKDYEARLEQAKDEKLMLQTDKGDGPTMILHKSELERAKIQAESEQIKLDLYRIKSPIDGTVLKVNVRAGEFAQAALLSTPLMVVGDIDPLHVRVEVDESEIHRFQSDKPAVASPRGQSQLKINLRFIRSEPLVVPKQVITGSTTERIDTRVLQVIYAIEDKVSGLSPGQQLDVFIRTTAE